MGQDAFLSVSYKGMGNPPLLSNGENIGFFRD